MLDCRNDSQIQFILAANVLYQKHVIYSFYFGLPSLQENHENESGEKQCNQTANQNHNDDISAIATR